MLLRARNLRQWRTEEAPEIAKSYWKLGEHGTVLDLMYAVRADEAEHRDVNHLLREWEKTKSIHCTIHKQS